jgi:hypothetical protein
VDTNTYLQGGYDTSAGRNIDESPLLHMYLQVVETEILAIMHDIIR